MAKQEQSYETVYNTLLYNFGDTKIENSFEVLYQKLNANQL